MTSLRAPRIIKDAIENKAFSASALFIASGSEIIEDYQGTTSFIGESHQVDKNTVFDLASLTKPLVTTTLLAILFDRGEIALDDKIGKYLPAFNKTQHADITIKSLLTHTSGLPAWLKFYEMKEAESGNISTLIDLISNVDFEYQTHTKCIYSDLDFIILGHLIEVIAKNRLDRVYQKEVLDIVKINDLFFLPIGEKGSKEKLEKYNIAATEKFEQGESLTGEVHDPNAQAFGGICGHAGLFGTAKAVWSVMEIWKKALLGNSEFFKRETAHEFVFPQNMKLRSSYVLGWDRPEWKTSQAGRHISAHSIGHLGFTGTSTWLDFDRDLCVLLLVNSPHSFVINRSSTGTKLSQLRRSIYTKIYEDLEKTEHGSFAKPKNMNDIKHIHMTAIAGTGMGAVAGLLKDAGYDVTGSDEAVYPPMSDLLAKMEIPVKQPFSPKNLDETPDLVVIGNVCTRDHAEVVEIKRRKIPYTSFAGMIEKAFLPDRKSLVVSGTHGKTTTSSMLAWMLESAKLDPSFMIGGVVKDFGRSFKLSKGDFFVLEGDEYDTAYFDKFPKFMHYSPFGAIITSIEFDHADIFDSLEEIENHFAEFVKLIPKDGYLVACFDYQTVRKVSENAKCKVISYGQSADAMWRIEEVKDTEFGMKVTISRLGEIITTIELPMSGDHNALNALAAFALLYEQNISKNSLLAGIKSFSGIARRQQVRLENDRIRIIDDFAHHPTAIKVTLDGLKRRYSENRLIVAFDPRTNTTSRNIFQDELAKCFENADLVFLGNPSRMDRIPVEKRLDVDKLASEISKSGAKARHIGDIEEMARSIVEATKAGDTIAVLSNGSFSGLIEKLIKVFGE